MPDEKNHDESNAPMDAAHARVREFAASQRAIADVAADTRARVVAANIPDHRLPPTVFLAMRVDKRTGETAWTLFDSADEFVLPGGDPTKGVSRQIVMPMSRSEMASFIKSIGAGHKTIWTRTEFRGWTLDGELSVPLAAREHENPAVCAFAEAQKNAAPSPSTPGVQGLMDLMRRSGRLAARLDAADDASPVTRAESDNLAARVVRLEIPDSTVTREPEIDPAVEFNERCKELGKRVRSRLLHPAEKVMSPYEARWIARELFVGIASMRAHCMREPTHEDCLVAATGNGWPTAIIPALARWLGFKDERGLEDSLAEDVRRVVNGKPDDR